MKIWEAVAMLQEMDQTKECTVTFGQDKKVSPPYTVNTKVVSPAYYEQFSTLASTYQDK